MTDTEPTTMAAQGHSASDPDKTMIRLDELTKQFPGQAQPAVDRLSLEVKEGEIVVFVGPSGCGKTTSMELVNRLIEPTSGRIILDGDDVTDIDPNKLRQRIGYVIQETGLLPHRTIAQNIGTVPKLIGWKKDRINERVDELLGMVGMDPEQYRARYPKELSGGQRQRVGVTRAMAADPTVMLMDEPFGAIDPITRERLQNEFIRLQAQIKKTIIFVTHDIDEAIKMGDRIAVLRDQSHIAQYDTPENILTNPADDYVSDFIGSGASLKRLNLTRIRDVEMSADCPVGLQSDSHEKLVATLNASEWSAMLLLDDQRRPQRWVNSYDLRRETFDPIRSGLDAGALVEPHATLSDALNELIISNGGCATVVDTRGAFEGVVDLETIMSTIRAMREEHSRYYLAGKHPDVVEV